MNFSKIKEILKSMNISEESSKEFINILESWVSNQKNLLNEEFKKKLETAKQVCVEEVEAHKATLSRGLRVFLESKLEAIEKAAAKKRAIEESETVNTLKQVKALLEGVDIDGTKINQDLQAANKEKSALKKELAESRDALNREKAKISKLSEIAEKSIQRQKILEGKLTTMEHKIEESKVIHGKTLAEEKQPTPTKKVISEATKLQKDDLDVIAASI